MKIEEIKKLSNEVLGGQIIGLLPDDIVEQIDNMLYDLHGNIYYGELACDLNVIAEVEKFVVEKYADYDHKLMEVVRADFDIKNPVNPRDLVVTASPRQRAEAVLMVLQGE